jgi:glycosyltransferase involved in cell wall biosynthesis
VSLEAQAAFLSLQEHVRFTGFLQGHALHEALANVAAVVMPSIWEETAGNAAIEQMMRGGLVIASDIGGLGEVVGDTGLKFRVGDVNELTACLRQVMDSPTQMIEIGRKARQRALRLFAPDRMFDEYYNVYEELLVRGRTNLIS